MGPLSNQDGNSVGSDKLGLPLNTEKSVNVVNSGAGVMENFSNCNTLSESQNEIDIHIRDEDPGVTLAKEGSQEMIPTSLFTEDETVPESPSSSSKTTLQTDVVQDNSAASFECGVCSAVFRSKSGLQRHISFHNNQDGKSFICPHCYKM